MPIRNQTAMGSQQQKMSFILNFFSSLFSKRNTEKDLKKKRRMLQLTEKQIEVQEETYETLTETIESMKKHLVSIRERENEMVTLQQQTELELQEDYENYLKKEQKDEEYERKYAFSRSFLDETMKEKKKEIEQKINEYLYRISELEKKAEELLKTKKATQNSNQELHEEVERLEQTRLQNTVDSEYNHLDDDLEAGAATIPLTLNTETLQPSSEQTESGSLHHGDLWEHKGDDLT